MYKRILVPIDGSETSQRGLREAIALAKMLGAKMHLIHVISDYAVMVEMSSAIDFAKFRAGLHQHGRDLLESTAAEVRTAGVEASTGLCDPKSGRVADAIVQEASDAQCDLIVIGTHGRRGFDRALMGSDAERVLRRSPVPVLLVRAVGAAS
jgi:nucleotide-binding universal stress UspA family protein